MAEDRGSRRLSRFRRSLSPADRALIDTFEDLRGEKGEQQVAAGGSAFSSAAATAADEQFTLEPEDLSSAVVSTAALRKRLDQVERRLTDTGSVPAIAPAPADPRVDGLQRRVAELGEDLDRYVQLLETERRSNKAALDEQRTQARRERARLMREHRSELVSARQQALREMAAAPRLNTSPAARPVPGTGDNGSDESAPTTADPEARNKAGQAASTTRRPEHAESPPDGTLSSSERAELERRLDEERDRNAAQALRIMTLGRELADLRTRHAAVSAARAEAASEITESRRQAELATSRAETLRATVESLRSHQQIDADDETAARFDRRLAHERRTFEAALAQADVRHNAELTALIQRHEQELLARKASTDRALSEERATFEAALQSEHDRHRSELADERRRREFAIGQTQSRLDDALSELSARSEESAQIVQQTTADLRTGFDEERKQHTTEVNRLEAELEQASRRERRLKARLDAAVAAASEADSARAEAFESAKTELGEARERADRAAAHAATLRKERDEMASQVEALRAASDKTSSENADGQRQPAAADLASMQADHAAALRALRRDHDVAMQRAQAEAEQLRLQERQQFETREAELNERHRSEVAEARAAATRAVRDVELREQRVNRSTGEPRIRVARDQLDKLRRRLDQTERARLALLTEAREARAAAAAHERKLGDLQRRIVDDERDRHQQITRLQTRLTAAEQRLDHERRRAAKSREQLLERQVAAAAHNDERHRDALTAHLEAQEATAAGFRQRNEKLASIAEAADRRANLAARREADLETALEELRGLAEGSAEQSGLAP